MSKTNKVLTVGELKELVNSIPENMDSCVVTVWDDGERDILDNFIDTSIDGIVEFNEEVFKDNGIKIVTNKPSLLYIFGTTLDFSDGLNGKGFTFNNPNATRTCGCGESFAI